MTEQEVRELFSRLGRQLILKDAVPEQDIAAAEGYLGYRIPDALRAFYRLAGNAVDMTDHHDHFLPPSEWRLEEGKLVFLTENQDVVIYAFDTTDVAADPPVLMATNQEPYKWLQVCGQCSEFLRVMVHWEAAFGGALPLGGSAIVPKSIRKSLEAAFQPQGEVNAMWAYGKTGLAVCLVEWTDAWRIFVGACNEQVLEEIDKLGVVLEMNDE